jgi:hypothetical protein
MVMWQMAYFAMIHIAPLWADSHDGFEGQQNAVSTGGLTMLNEKGRLNPDTVSRQLARTDSNADLRSYARGEYLNERITMMPALLD